MNRAKARGTAAETAVVRWLVEHGYPLAERRALAGSTDRGDIAGLPCAVEVKDVKQVALSEWVDEAVAEAKNARASFGVVFRRRRGRPDVGEWFAVLRVSDFVELLRKAN